MHDSEVVASIVAGDPLGLAAAYDRYADPLYAYCRTLLSDPADAADAVQDTFVIAASRLGQLRDRDRLRPWLYAVARNEALRILRSRPRTSPFDLAPDVTDDVTDDSADVTAGAERADLRALLEDAAAGLNPGEREVIELQLRQGLEPAEVATVLGVSRSHAHALASRARQQLEACLAALLVGRAGRGECAELGAMLDGWDGRLTTLLRKRVHRHIERCATCDARRAYELRPARLLDLSPGAALAAGAALSLRLARGAPEGLRAHTLTLATGHEVGAVAHRAAVLGRAGAFGRGGFPRPAHGGAGGGRGPLRSSPQAAATVAAAVVVAVVVAAVAFALSGRTQTFSPAADPSPPGVSGPAAGPPAGATAGGAASTPSSSARPAAARRGRSSPSASLATSARPTAGATSPVAATTSAGPPTTAASPSAGPPSATPTTASPRPTPTAVATTPTPRPTPTPGSLAAYPPGGTLVLQPDGPGRQIDLSGSGAGDWYVSWSMSVSGDPDGAISLSAAAGTLTAADSTATVTVTARRFVPCGSDRVPTITVSPGDAVFLVCTSGSRHFGAATVPAAGGRRGRAR